MFIFKKGESRRKGKFESFMLGSRFRRRLGGSWLNRTLDRREFRRKGCLLYTSDAADE